MRLLIAVVCAVFALSSTITAKADRRVAFVVGNGAYKFVDPLINPPLDASAMASLLRNAGFEVVDGVDLGRDAMTARLREFAMKSQGADVALFFYAGHGIAVNGKNYLIPVDADLKSEMDVKFGAAIDVDVTLDQTMSDATVKLVFLDACRDNPFAAKIRSASRTRNVVVSTGLAEMKSGEGTLIAFATGPGQTALDGQKGSNSPFTRALLAHVATPGLEIQQAMTRVRAQVNEETSRQQLPWGHTNLIGSVFLNPATEAAEAPPAAAPAVAATVSAGSEVELEFWRSIKDSNKPEELGAYLMKYPNGQFKPIALARLAALQQQPSAPAEANAPASNEPMVRSAEASPATESALRLEKAERLILQRQLAALGFGTPGNGMFNDRTRRAITDWQLARGYPTGYLNKLQRQALLEETPPAAETRSFSPPPPARKERAQRPAAAQRAPQQQQQPARQQDVDPAAAAAIMRGMMGGFGRIGR